MTDMSRPSLRIDMLAMLMDSGSVFSATDSDRHLDTGTRDLARVKPQVKNGTLSVTAELAEYIMPADMLRPYSTLWGLAVLRQKKPWNRDWPGELPHMTLDSDGIQLQPAPTSAQITLLGAEYKYRYVAVWTIGDLAADTNIPNKYRDLLLIRSAAAAMQDLAGRGVTKPVQLGGCGGSPAANGTPAALSEKLMALFERMAK